MPKVCFEDFIPGQSTSYGRYTVDKDELVGFARAYDPQDFHTDEEAARSSFAGELIASGWMTAACHQRMICDEYLNDSSCMGSPGIEELKWIRPVRPGDVLHARRRVLAAKVSASKPDRGVVHVAQELFNQDDEPVLFQSNWIMFGLRHPKGLPASSDSAPATGAPARLDDVPERPALPPERSEIAHIALLDDVIIGSTLDLGSYTFSAAEIIDFSRRYDPQYFHIDPVAARSSQFGGLIASGWHTASGWMRSYANARASAVATAEARGERVAVLGPSPGFRNLRWLKPVHAGDTIRYRSTFVDKRASASRPGWGLVFHHNTGTNQHGVRVFEFTGCVFWESRRP